MSRLGATILLLVLGLLPALSVADAPGLSPASLPAVLQTPNYEASILPGADYDPSVPTPEDLLGFELGERPASAELLVSAFEAIAAASDRVRLERYGESHEGRPLIYAVVGNPARVADLDALRADHAKMAFPDDDDEALARIADEAPAVVWIGAAVHGNEPSGADAALALLYHYAACRDEDALAILDGLILLIDPMMNPDGRARFMADRMRYSGRVPATDRQSLPHQNPWPSARGNHYFLDLNRDWHSLTQPETRGRVRVLLDWHPQVTFDLHEMGAFDTYLFSPPRAPFNPHLPASVHGWWRALADNMGLRFGRRGWSCYSEDWHEEFNPNRGAAWPLHLGAVALLAEQSSTRGAAVKRPDGTVITYAEAVHHQLEAVLGLIEVSSTQRRDLHEDFIRARRGDDLDDDRPRAFIIDVQTRPENARRLAANLTTQDIEVGIAQMPFSQSKAVNYYGETRGGREFAAGSFIVDLSGGERRLAQAILDFDPELGDEFLSRERQYLEMGQGSQLYENTAWSLAMVFGCEVYASDQLPGVNTVPLGGLQRFAGHVKNAWDTTRTPPYGWLIEPDDWGAAAALAYLHAAGVRCWAATEPFVKDGVAYGAGTVIVKRMDNDEDIEGTVSAAARRSGAQPVAVMSSLTDSGPDMGSRRYRLLAAPRVAILAGRPFYSSTFGALWHFVDQELSLPASLLRLSQLRGGDIAKYNVIIAPDAGSGRGAELLGMLGEQGRLNLEHWLKQGGTLVTVGESNWMLFDELTPLSNIRPRRQVLNQLDDYRREALVGTGLDALTVSEESLRSGEGPAMNEAIDAMLAAAPADTSLAMDEYRRRFRPIGAICRVNLDDRHWLAAGVGDRVPVLVKTDLALMSRRPVQTVGRFAEAEKIRLSGLLWPEAAERWAQTSYLCREKIGRGQVIAFLGNPVYRANFPGTSRLLANAILLGPGMGGSVPASW